jgi:hypothetical protein
MISRTYAMCRNRKADIGINNIAILLIILAFLFIVIVITTDVGGIIVNMIKGFFGMFG